MSASVWTLAAALCWIGSARANGNVDTCSVTLTGVVLRTISDFDCITSLSDKIAAEQAFATEDCPCIQQMSPESADRLQCLPFDGADTTIAQTYLMCSQSDKARLTASNGNLMAMLPMEKRFLIRSGIGEPIDVGAIPDTVHNLSVATSSAIDQSQKQANAFATAAVMNQSNVLEAKFNSNTQLLQTQMINAIDTMKGEFSSSMQQLQGENSKLRVDLNDKILQLQKTKANLATQQKFMSQYAEEVPALSSRIQDIERHRQHSGANLVKASDLQGTKNAGWDQPLDDKLAEYDTFLDGLPVRITSSREVGGGGGSKCYPGWGRTNKFKIDPRKTYEFSIWIRSTVHNSKMANYFGFTLFYENGTKINKATRQEVYSNTYFKSSRTDSSEWTKFYGYLLGSDYVTEAINSSLTLGDGCKLYRCLSGRNTIQRSGMYRIMHPLAGYGLLRFGSCYAENNGNDNTKYTMPMVREIDAERAMQTEKVGSYADLQSSSSNLVRHSNFVNTRSGPSKVPAYGGDAWKQPPPWLEMVQFDGFGSPTPIVAAPSRESRSTGCYTGWGHTNYIRINPSVKYEFSIWIRSSDPGMNNYFGFHMFDANYNRIGGLYSNPYFKCGDQDTENWVQWKGYLVPQSTQGIRDQQCGHEYKGSTFTRQASYRILPNVRYALLRYGSCYSNGDSRGETHYAFPSVKAMIGK